MTTVDDMDYEFRTARAEDTQAIAALDGSFTTRTIFHVAVTEGGFALKEIPVDPPIRKVFDTTAPARAACARARTEHAAHRAEELAIRQERGEQAQSAATVSVHRSAHLPGTRLQVSNPIPMLQGLKGLSSGIALTIELRQAVRF
ncbi:MULTISPECIES: hypothetical protein [unclassified Streptomyces]|uniref:hypothetical protein n=1 Tax=unclassified Streptomyces TaxID=2593676 RepID=UPI00087DF6C2|nr:MULTISPECIES: hypothetical protein [unclassified Streptomyces]PBC80234.1 hypothetical protein BX261_0045 [Streptomyces sp. 2321.6]SDR59666.1 hypothetical protein SAMN05216511_7182 [Streptomyces sp. KS_16]SEB67039.1 hypothetical protein SAMN05428940_0045 [Streptomyces sp. 2133.1]SNC59421.1 hypothetical protein SAMN06272741_0048 [Streptomyces sp. 2114.4]